MATSDFRSDTVTRPTDAMRRAMAEAEVGDDVLDGDPTVAALEQRAAEWLGKEGALFVPSGTMANQIAVGCWTTPGAEVVLERSAHVLVYEAGALGALHGVQTITLEGERGALVAGDVRAALRPDYVHCPRTELVCTEQTHMAAGGRVVPLESLLAVQEVCRTAGVPIHMDGARLAHAVVASGTSAATWAATADSVSLCFSKGLGAPVGSVVAGDGAFLERAKVLRKRFGGWMRQSGVLAAPARLALDEGVERLADDHRLARDLATRLHALPGLDCAPELVETNLVFARVSHPELDAASLAAALEAAGVRVLQLSTNSLRFITHRDVGPDDVARCVEAAEGFLRSPQRRSAPA